MDIVKKYQKIRAEFSSVFGNCTLTNNKINRETIDYKEAYSLADYILNFPIKIKSKPIKLYDLITHIDVIDIIIDTIEQYASAFNEKKEETVLLSMFIDYAHFLNLLDRNLNASPLSLTTALIPIPFAPLDNHDIQISNNITLSTDSLIDYETFDSPRGFGLRILNSNSGEKIPVLKISKSGYPSRDKNSDTILSILSRYKEFVIVCMLMGLIEFSENIFHERKFLNFFITDNQTKKIKHRFPMSVNESLFAFKKNKTFEKDFFVDGNIISAFFNNTSVDKHIICSSLVWLFDSYLSEDTLTSIINLSISIESLLSDENKQKATEALVSKFAYSLGTLPSVRSHLKEEMEKFYNIRSNIVHGRDVKSKKEAHDKLVMIRIFFEKELKREIDCLVNRKRFLSLF